MHVILPDGSEEILSVAHSLSIALAEDNVPVCHESSRGDRRGVMQKVAEKVLQLLNFRRIASSRSRIEVLERDQCVALGVMFSQYKSKQYLQKAAKYGK